VNAADERTLAALPGVGATLARRIVEERESGGPYRGPDDLVRVRGVTRELARRLEALVEFGVTGGKGPDEGPAAGEGGREAE
jgi:competence protein ComEA